MSRPGFAHRFTTAAMVLVALLVVSGSNLRAQNASMAAPSAPSAVGLAVSEPVTQAEPAKTATAEAGPRTTPPLERYQGTLPHQTESDRPAMASGGGSHTIVLSTLALVLIVIIVVLLVVD